MKNKNPRINNQNLKTESKKTCFNVMDSGINCLRYLAEWLVLIMASLAKLMWLL